MKKDQKIKADATDVAVAITTEAVETTPEIVVEVITPISLPVVEKKPQGRPISTTSERQKRLAARAERVASGGSDRPGRPTSAVSARQQAIEARNARIAAGDIPKRGRPPFPKPAVVNPAPAVEVTNPAEPITDDAVTSA